MSVGDQTLIEAAGGVLARSGSGGTEIAVVHRPKYDDWSLPKGKLRSGEHPLVGAVREVTEETGFGAVVRRPLGEIRYLKDGMPKRVRYWSMLPTEGRFAPNDEVDELVWLPLGDALDRLDRDRSVLDAYAGDLASTTPLLLTRHGSAGQRGEWPGNDDDRPLDETGTRQAGLVAALLSAYGVTRVLSADVARCRETVAPYATARGIPIENDPLLSEAGYASSPDVALEHALTAFVSQRPTVLCSQGGVIPDLVGRVCAAFGAKPPDDPRLRKGATWVFHVATGPHRVVATERLAV